jgi:hypothetical protein
VVSLHFRVSDCREVDPRNPTEARSDREQGGNSLSALNS